ncbi:phosphodiester glycosidase family protein [Streptomyces sp. M41]|uniref:phosphodiester glycosidase family protein n=1 Tax=Streptomyces sp. M41 TaxID=3059412 RepID=UPI00374DDB69
MKHSARPTRLRAAQMAILVTASLAVPIHVFGADADPPTSPAVLEKLKHTSPQAGLELYQGELPGGSAADFYTITMKRQQAGSGVGGDADDRLAGGQLLTEGEAQELQDKLRKAGFTPRAERIEWPTGADRTGLLGVRVRVGQFKGDSPAQGRTQAEAHSRALAAAGFTKTAVEWTGADGTPGSGKTQAVIAIIDPAKFKGSLKASYGKAVASQESVTATAKQDNALLAINGGFFDVNVRDKRLGGTAAGITAYAGALQSAATNGRIAAILRGNGFTIDFKHLSTQLRVGGPGGNLDIDGINRELGRIQNCGGTGGDKPTERPQHDVSCTDADEVVQYTGQFGIPTPAGEGVEAVLDAGHRVIELHEKRGHDVPADGSILAGIGTGADWLRQHAQKGTQLKLEHTIVDEQGRRVDLGPDDDIVSGGPELVQQGQVAVDYGADGIERLGDPDFAYAWGLKRHPRTLIGVDAEGRVLLVTANGRDPGKSDGLSLNEAANLMKGLNATSAMNLDGGGSSTMAHNGTMLTTPPPGSGERPVGNALLLTTSENQVPGGPTVPSAPAVPSAPPAEPPVSSVPSAPSVPSVEPPVSPGNVSSDSGTTGDAGACATPTWDRYSAYKQGDTVTYAGRTWRAQWWNQNSEPGGPTNWAGVWKPTAPTC